ncbi:hypothetical protein SAMN04489752_3435 [Brevibacterium siliguriense]|uniref:Uncharacterized protein n=1 Tax=Brevibacterium siliguriense TaxID=1136497 RepID=A0A1H1XU01_9MICO|nr:hypothetical protein [Brevibacterium siliguriense]SDT12707.1 hypothetical protein SAMN04489752_3435 [Brevibacterium siliguriense]
MTADDAPPTVHDDRLTAEDLLASPRGRSLVFGLALEQVESFPRTGDEEAPGVEAVVRNLRCLCPVAPTWSAVKEAMSDVVDAAVYWQPPDDDDWGTAEIGAVREILRPFAEKLVSTGLLDAWSKPLDPDDQWALAWDDKELNEVNGRHSELPAVFNCSLVPVDTVAGRPTIALADLFPPLDRDGTRLPWGLDEWLADVLTTETAYRHDFAKNPYEEVSGEWWSTPPIGLWSSTGTWPDGTPIGVELVEDDLGLERARACRLKLRPDARIAEISRPEDWAELCRRYPLDVTAQRRYVWFETTGRKGRWVIPDWSRVAEEFDGVHVGMAGYLLTAGAVIDVTEGRLGEESENIPTAGNTDDRTASVMAGWHPDATFWLNDVIDAVTEVVEWHYDGDADRWVRG